MEFDDTTPMISVRLSKSGKAVLIYDENGFCWMTSVAFMEMLCKGKARNNMISARLMGNNTTNNFKPKDDSWDASKIIQVDGNPLSANADRQRQVDKVKVKGDW